MGKKEIILFLFSSIIEYNDPADWAMFCLHHKCCFHQFLTQKLDRKEYCAAISGNCKNTQILSYWEHLIPAPLDEIWNHLHHHPPNIHICLLQNIQHKLSQLNDAIFDLFSGVNWFSLWQLSSKQNKVFISLNKNAQNYAVQLLTSIFHCIIIPNNWHSFFTCLTFNGINHPGLVHHLFVKIHHLPST